MKGRQIEGKDVLRDGSFAFKSTYKVQSFLNIVFYHL